MTDNAETEQDDDLPKLRVSAIPFVPDEVPTPSVRLEEDYRHPVLVFGSSMSGKSTMIMSLIHALEKSGTDRDVAVNVSFGNSFYAKRDERTQMQLQFAQDFFETGAHNFISGRRALETTQADTPFFIPIDLTVKGYESHVVKIAIMDGRGEWYEPVREPGTSIFQDLRDDILEVLRNYSHGISVICVAPHSLGEDDQHDTSSSDAGLYAALSKYQEARSHPDRQDDSLLFLLSKWDQVASPQRDERFIHLMGNDVIHHLNSRFPRSWNKFSSLPIGDEDGSRRCFMQYSSCSFVDGKPRIQPHLEKEYLRYPRTVLNWIYGNARRFEERDDDTVNTSRLVLFPDVIPPDTKLIPISEKLLRLITA